MKGWKVLSVLARLSGSGQEDSDESTVGTIADAGDVNPRGAHRAQWDGNFGAPLSTALRCSRW